MCPESENMISRRTIIGGSLTATAAAICRSSWAQTTNWWVGERLRGFNFTQKMHPNASTAYPEKDFELIANWGFNFVRLPTNYRIWTNPDGSYREEDLKEFDAALLYGRRHEIHICIAFIDAPGYEHQTGKPEDRSLLDPSDAGRGLLQQFVTQWTMFAARYKGVPARYLSFNLLNEPHSGTTASYAAVVRQTVAAIRHIDPERPVIADGTHWGTVPMFDLVDLDIGQSTRGYNPRPITAFGMRPPDADPSWPMPQWPMTIDGQLWDKAYLKRVEIDPWVAIQKRGTFVHVGEFGIFYKVPAVVAYSWLEDQLELWRDAGFGWAMWSLVNGFGILDNHRPGSKTDLLPDGRQIDRGMLDLMRSI